MWKHYLHSHCHTQEIYVSTLYIYQISSSQALHTSQHPYRQEKKKT